MTDTYKDAKEQLDQIVEQVRKKDVSLEKSLDLLEEGVALANRCTELIDQAAWEEADDVDDLDAADDETAGESHESNDSDNSNSPDATDLNNAAADYSDEPGSPTGPVTDTEDAPLGETA